MAKTSSVLFSVLLFSSLLIIGALSLDHTSSSTNIGQTKPILVFLGGLLPLVIYHISLSFQKGHLTQDKVDSVYFFGFLVTLATLGSSAFILSTKGVTAINTVGVQFALGLLVTGYGLWARITLQSKISTDANLDATLNSYIDKVGILNDEFQNTINLFKKLSSDAAKDVKDAGTLVMNTIAEGIEAPASKISTHLKSFSKQIEKFDSISFEHANKALQDFSSSLQSASSETPKLSQQMSVLSQGLGVVNQNYSLLSESIQKEIQGLSTLTSVLTVVSKSGVDVTRTLNEFGATIDAVAKINTSDISNITESIKGFFVAIEDSRLKIEKLQITIAQSQNNVVSTFESTKDSLGNQAEELNSATIELSKAMSGLASSLSHAANKLTA